MASYEEIKPKQWSVRFRWINEEGKEVNKRISGFKTKKLAEQAYMNFLFQNKRYEKSSSESFEIREQTLQSLLPEYFAFKASRVKGSTIYSMEQNFQRNIVPMLGNLKVGKIDKTTILKWQNSLDEKNYSYKYKTNIRVFLSNFFRYLNRYYDIENPVSKVDNFVRPKIKEEMQIWTLEQFETFISFSEEPFKTFFKTLYFLGLRLGECLALSPKDIDFEKNTVDISKSLTEKVKGMPFEIVAPKNMSSYREIGMPEELSTALKKYLEEFKPTTYLFGSERPLPTTTLRRRYNTYLKLSGVPKIKLHDFRHSHASLLVELGANVVLIAKRLGHKNIEMTLNTYSHLMPNSERELLEKLNKKTSL